MGGDSPVCRNAAEIARYVGIGSESVKKFKKDYGLPVWQIDGKGNWKGLKVSLDAWLVRMESEYLEHE